MKNSIAYVLCPATLLVACVSAPLWAGDALPLRFGEPIPFADTSSPIGQGVHRGCMTADRRTLYFDRWDPDPSGARGWIFRARCESTQPDFPTDFPPGVPIGGPVAEKGSVLFPAVSPEGDRLYFTVWLGRGGFDGAQIWVAEKRPGEEEFDEVYSLDDLNADSGDWSLMGDVLRNEAGEETHVLYVRRSFRLHVATFVEPGEPRSGFRDERALDELYRHYNGFDFPPSITPDGRYLFWSERPEEYAYGRPPRDGGFGCTDLWMASRLPGEEIVFRDPVNLGSPPNSPRSGGCQDYGRELCPWVSPDGSTLVFGRARRGLWMVEMEEKLVPSFIRGDCNADDNADLSDAVFVLNYLFLGGTEPGCKDAADSDDSGSLEITDAVYLLNYLFLGGPEPPEPYPACGADETADELTCQAFAGCGAEP